METTQSTGEVNPFQYAGRENDGATGLYYHRARYYRPEWGRFLSADPIGFAGGLNHYAYAGNNPLGTTDPTGLAAGDWLTALWRWILARFQVTLAPGTPTLQTPFRDAEWADDPTITAERDRFGLAGRGVAAYLDDLGSAAVSQIVLGAGLRSAVLTLQRLEHIVLRHWGTAGTGPAGRFLVGTPARRVIDMIDQTLRHGTVRPNTGGRPGDIFEYDFGTQIGVDIAGNPATRLRVVRGSNGEVVTAFPF